MSVIVDLNLDSAKLVIDPTGNVHFLDDTQSDLSCHYTNVVSGKAITLEAASVDIESFRNIAELDQHALMDIVRKLARVCAENLREKAFLRNQISEMIDK